MSHYELPEPTWEDLLGSLPGDFDRSLISDIKEKARRVSELLDDHASAKASSQDLGEPTRALEAAREHLRQSLDTFERAVDSSGLLGSQLRGAVVRRVMRDFSDKDIFPYG